MSIRVAVIIIALGVGCATKDPKMVKTRVVTFPNGALVEFNGLPAGRAPASITLPQDDQGRLTEFATVRALPNTKQDTLFAQVRTFNPTNRMIRVPNQIMIDMRHPDPNAPTPPSFPDRTPETSQSPGGSTRSKIPYTERSKPTQAVGLDRWDPGHH